MKANKAGKRPTIGIFSSSSPISATVPVRYERGKQYLENKGFKIIDGSLCGKQDFYRSGTIKERADEFINWTTQDRSKEERKNEWLCINPECAEVD